MNPPNTNPTAPAPTDQVSPDSAVKKTPAEPTQWLPLAVRIERTERLIAAIRPRLEKSSVQRRKMEAAINAAHRDLDAYLVWVEEQKANLAMQKAVLLDLRMEQFRLSFSISTEAAK